MTPPRMILSLTVGGLLAGIIAAQQIRVTHLQKRVDDVQEKFWQKRVDSVRIITDTVAVQMAAAVKTVTKTIEKVRVDTFVIHPRTAADTSHAVAQLPTLVVEHDKLQRECTDLGNKCKALEVAVTNERAATKVQIAGLERALKEKRKRTWLAAPDLVFGVGECATMDGLRGCVFAGVGGRIGW